jgi:superfamily I DNA/RNA helicase
MGMFCLRQAVRPRGNDWIDDRKYHKLADRYLLFKGYGQGESTDVIKSALLDAVRFARLTLVDLTSDADFDAMCGHYDIDMVPGLRQMAFDILERGMELADEVIDFTDMIWLPIALNINMKKFGFIMVDEAQDLSACQRELVRRMMYPNSRLVAVGDPKQAIFGFCGAGTDSVDRIVEEFGCTLMPLSVCYRCPSTHLDLAREIVPQIEARENAPEGEVIWGEYEKIKDLVDAKRGDLVMCRVNAPLVELAFFLLGEGIPAVLKGRDLMSQLINLAKATLKLPGASWERFQDSLNDYVSRQSMALARKDGTEMQIQALQDRAAALSIIVNRAQALDQRITRIDGLERFIERLYGSENGAVVLSSVHKAKGLEADHTVILAPEKMPHPMARSPWAQEQELNLRYVALTRARKSLTFIPLPKESK